MRNSRTATISIVVVLVITAFATSLALAYGHDKRDAKQPEPQSSSVVKSESSVTNGSVTVGGKRIPYKAITGVLAVKNGEGKPYVSMSYVAYVKDGVKDTANRPITFFYNGGPGSSTIWLNMLAYGPKRVAVEDAVTAPPAPYKLVNNDESLLDVTDEVFIDAPGTGFGQIITKELGGVGTPEMVYGIDEDARAFTSFIKQYLTESSRWNSPKYLYGESYGTTRNAIVANYLTRDGVSLNGVVFQSAVINWAVVLQFAKAQPGVNIDYATGFPTEAAAAWYHNKISNRPAELMPFLKKAEEFAMGPYLQALNKGNLLDDASRRKIAEQMHAYLGLSTDYILKANLRVDAGQFRQELLRDQGEVAGRLDARYTGAAFDTLAESGEYGPLTNAVGAPVTALFNDYVRNTLEFGKNREYKISANVGKYWKDVHVQPGMRRPMTYIVNVMPDLSNAMKLNPSMKVMVAGGYYDLGTPYFAAKYEFEQLNIPRDLQKNISYHFYKSGHMMYVNRDIHKELHDASASFILSGYKAQN